MEVSVNSKITCNSFNVCVHICVCVCVCVCVCSVVSYSLSLWIIATMLLCPWNFPGKNTGVGGNFLLQGIFPTQRLNPGLFHLLQWQVDSLPLHHLPNQGLIISDKKPSLIIVILFQPNLGCFSDFTEHRVTLKLDLFYSKNCI